MKFEVKVFQQMYRESIYSVDSDTKEEAEMMVKRSTDGVVCTSSKESEGQIIEIITTIGKLTLADSLSKC